MTRLGVTSVAKTTEIEGGRYQCRSESRIRMRLAPIVESACRTKRGFCSKSWHIHCAHFISPLGWLGFKLKGDRHERCGSLHSLHPMRAQPVLGVAVNPGMFMVFPL